MMPKTQYAKSGDLHIAYQVIGDGPLNLVYVPTWVSQVEHVWEDPSIAHFFARVGRFARLVIFDRRGSGLSDPVVGAPTLEEQMDDVLAVIDAAGVDQAAIFAQIEGSAMAMMFAATHPERTRALALFHPWAKLTRAADYPHGNTREERDGFAEQLLEQWGTGATAWFLAPSMANDERFREWFARLERLGASPGTARALIRQLGATDVRDVLPAIRVPTVVLVRPANEAIDLGHCRYVAQNIPGAVYRELPGTDALAVFGDPDTAIDEMQEFLTGTRPDREPDRVLATVLFTDIVGSTRRAAELGDARWRELLARHDALVRDQLRRHRGREIKSTGDGFLATFDGPARGLACARSVVDEVRELGLEIRAGLHTGECEMMGNDVGGIAVHIGARVAQLAQPSEVLVSSTVKDLVVGSGLEFADRGPQPLKGVPGEWRLYAVA